VYQVGINKGIKGTFGWYFISICRELWSRRWRC